MLKHADLILTARSEGKLVGVSRAITDFSFSTYLADLAVAVAFQRRGIGRELIPRTHEAAGLHTMLILLAAPRPRGITPMLGMTQHNSCWIVPPAEESLTSNDNPICSRFFGITTACWWIRKGYTSRRRRQSSRPWASISRPTSSKRFHCRRGESTLTLAAARGVNDEEITRLRAERDRIYAETLDAQSCLIDGVEEVLRSLHGKVRMGVVTSTSREHFQIAHAKSGVPQCMDFVITREDCQHLKPHPEPYLTALNRHRLRPEECIVVEDSERGLASAMAAGLEMPDCPERVDQGRRFPASPKDTGQHPVRSR